jgi:hypothetical protein
MTTLFHTSATHILRFDTIRDRLAPDIQLNHVVRTDWLDRARGGIDKRLRTEIMDAVGTARGPVLCSCSTIGGIAAEAGAIRIDQPMMQAAADIGGRILVAYCLMSTATPTLELLYECLDGRAADIHSLPLPHLWALFESGDTEAFEQSIAAEVDVWAGKNGTPDVVVLAQASMSGAQEFATVDCPILTSPETAFRALMAELG